MLRFKKIYYIFSGTLVGASIVAILVFGLNFGIDFTGGTLWVVHPSDSKVTALQIEQILESQADLKLGDVKAQSLDPNIMLRLRNLSEAEHQQALEKIKAVDPQLTENRFESIGPVIGQELKRKAIWQLLIVLIGIMLYIAWSFRKVGQLKENSKISWKFGGAAVVALFHDVIITVGVFAVLGHFYNVEVDSSFIAAVLLVLGYSVNDTIVVFDRIRENMIKHRYNLKLGEIINTSVGETFARSLNTSTTTILVLFTILFFGGPAIFYFVLALSIGIGIGTYSSIFLASPILYDWEK